MAIEEKERRFLKETNYSSCHLCPARRCEYSSVLTSHDAHEAMLQCRNAGPGGGPGWLLKLKGDFLPSLSCRPHVFAFSPGNWADPYVTGLDSFQNPAQLYWAGFSVWVWVEALFAGWAQVSIDCRFTRLVRSLLVCKPNLPHSTSFASGFRV